MLENYYNVESVARNDGEAVYTVSLNPDCEVYRGHFPGNPVSPGVCNIRMIQECARKECLLSSVAGGPGSGNLYIEEIRQCRFTSLVSPLTHPRLDVHVSLEDLGARRFGLTASIVSEGTVCLSMKAVCRMS